MCSAQVNRFEWLKAVMQLRAEEATPTVKNVATALAVQFTSHETGQLNPGLTTLADYLDLSLATVKRAVRTLVKAGWLHRTEGRGAGNRTAYTLITPGNIVPFRRKKEAPAAPQKKGSDMSLSGEKKGSLVSRKGVTGDLSYIEQSLEQKTRAKSETSSKPQSFPLRTVLDTDESLVSEWNLWLTQVGYPALEHLGVRSDGNEGSGFRLPRRFPPRPDDDEGQSMVRAYLDCCCERIEGKAARYAAE